MRGDKMIRFGLLGALGCLAGWLVGEGFLWLALPSKADAGTPSIATKPAPASPVLVELPPPPPPSDKDFAERLRNAGAGSGDVTISLKWDNFNDLDLHCIDPTGEEISFSNKKGKTGGHLDVDRNAGRRQTRKPVENIFWPSGKAPVGKYFVYVEYFSNNGDPDPTKFFFSVRWDGKVHEDSAMLSRREPKKLVFEFELTPRLRLAAADVIEVNQDGKNLLPIKIARDRFTGPVTINLQGDLAGITAPSITIPEQDTDAKLEIGVARIATPGTRELIVLADGNKAQEKQKIKLTIAALPESEARSGLSLLMILIIGAWTALLALGLALALVIGQNRHLGRPALPANQAVVVIGGAVLAGLVGGAVAQALLGLLSQTGVMSQLGFLVGWLILGGLVGRGLVFFIANLDAKRATLAGAVGGVLGALTFIGVSSLGDMAGRGLGAAILGTAIGLVVVLVEMTCRSAWLEVRRGPREVVSVNLGERTVSIGSDGKACTVYVSGIAPVAYRYRLRGGQITCENVATGQTQNVSMGHSQKCGTVEVTIRGEVGAAPVTMTAPIPSPAPPTQSSAIRDACPGCGRATPGQPGRRYCLLCDRTF